MMAVPFEKVYLYINIIIIDKVYNCNSKKFGMMPDTIISIRDPDTNKGMALPCFL